MAKEQNQANQRDMRGRRRNKIRELIAQLEIKTQSELVEALHAAGYPVTQATISRDIKEMHLLKIPTKDRGYKYTLPTDVRFNPLQKLKRALDDHFQHIDFTENLVVIKCMPGTANTLGALIDGLGWTEILGTICGDDTILIICRTKKQSEYVVNQIMGFI